jgi:hypothetical protein
MYVICYYKSGGIALFTKGPTDKTPAQLVTKRYRKVGYVAYEVALEASFYLTRPLCFRPIQLAVR